LNKNLTLEEERPGCGEPDPMLAQTCLLSLAPVQTGQQHKRWSTIISSPPLHNTKGHSTGSRRMHKLTSHAQLSFGVMKRSLVLQLTLQSY